jgi:hypothetical protein
MLEKMMTAFDPQYRKTGAPQRRHNFTASKAGKTRHN